MPDKIPMTPSGHVALTEEYRVRTSEERPRIIRDIAEARAHGDLSENAEYHAAKEQQSLNEGRIKELEGLLALAEIVDISKLSGSTVKFGATVKIVDEDTEKEVKYTIVGDAEADAVTEPVVVLGIDPTDAVALGRRQLQSAWAERLVVPAEGPRGE